MYFEKILIRITMIKAEKSNFILIKYINTQHTHLLIIYNNKLSTEEIGTLGWIEKLQGKLG
jgi:hypothetical protein